MSRRLFKLTAMAAALAAATLSCATAKAKPCVDSVPKKSKMVFFSADEVNIVTADGEEHQAVQLIVDSASLKKFFEWVEKVDEIVEKAKECVER